MAKSVCKVCGQWFEDSELDEHLNQHLESPVDEHKEPPLKCSSCDTVMDVYYGVPFRVGGTGPAMRALIGEWAELGEQPIPIDLFVCKKCGRIQLFASEKTRRRLSRAAPHIP